jgi:S-methylmethionine-dependent homocysteine/selenocysteine methylase
MRPPLSTRLHASRPVILDGALGSELELRGVDTGLPLWSANAVLHAPDAVRLLHEDYIRAGADVIATCTFRTTARTFRRAGLPDRSAELTDRAVALACEARTRCGRDGVLVGGSMGPLEDCYRPDLVPPSADVRREQGEHARRLAGAGADLLLLETMGTIREAFLAAEAARETGLEFVVSFLGGNDGRLSSGEEIPAAVRRIAPLRPAAICINCVPPGRLDPLLAALLASLETLPPGQRCPAGVYANAGVIGGNQALPIVCDVSPGEYALLARRWRTMGIRLIGGCCGTGPSHIASLARLVGT